MPGQQQPLRFQLREFVIRVLPHVVHAARRQAHQEAAVLGAPDARPHHVVERERRIERHVRLVLVLAEPGGQVRIAVVAVLVEDHHDRSDFALDLLELPHVDAAFVPLADRLANVDAVENRGGERLDAHALLGEDALALLLQKAAVILDDQVLGRIGADAAAVELAGPFAGELLLLARLQAVRPHAGAWCSGSRRRSRMRRVSIQTSSPEIRTVSRSDSSFCGG